MKIINKDDIIITFKNDNKKTIIARTSINYITIKSVLEKTGSVDTSPFYILMDEFYNLNDKNKKETIKTLNSHIENKIKTKFKLKSVTLNKQFDNTIIKKIKFFPIILNRQFYNKTILKTPTS